MLFLDDTFCKSVNVKDYFPDAGKFIKSITTLQKVVGSDLLDGKKCYRLRKLDLFCLFLSGSLLVFLSSFYRV